MLSNVFFFFQFTHIKLLFRIHELYMKPPLKLFWYKGRVGTYSRICQFENYLTVHKYMQFNEARCLPADFAHSKKFEVNFKTTLSIDSLKYSNKSLSLKYLKILKKKHSLSLKSRWLLIYLEEKLGKNVIRNKTRLLLIASVLYSRGYMLFASPLMTFAFCVSIGWFILMLLNTQEEYYYLRKIRIRMYVFTLRC